MASEYILNQYFNKGGFNRPQLVGYTMNLISELKPESLEEWKKWYIQNVHNEQYIDILAIKMHKTIPEKENVTLDECKAYIRKVLFERNYIGYMKEKLTMEFLQKEFTEKFEHAPKEWDTNYFIDFFVPETDKHPLIGIQLKPDSFYKGRYYKKVDIEGKMKRFKDEKRALAYVLRYSTIDAESTELSFCNPEVIGEIKRILGEK